MEQVMKVVVLGASRYSFEDEKTGREIEGCKVHYITIGDQGSEDQLGSIPKSETMPYSYFKELAKVPGLYDATVTMQMSGRQLKAKITDFKFLEAVTFELPAKV